MNIEDYVTYEQAIKLKELGFNWEVNHYYNLDKELIENIADYSDEDVNFGENTSYEDFNTYKIFRVVCSAPSLEQTAKWLREKGIIISIVPECTAANTFKAQLYDSFHRILFIRKVTEGLGNHDSYEAALSAGIDAALKIIGRK